MFFYVSCSRSDCWVLCTIFFLSYWIRQQMRQRHSVNAIPSLKTMFCLLWTSIKMQENLYYLALKAYGITLMFKQRNGLSIKVKHIFNMLIATFHKLLYNTSKKRIKISRLFITNYKNISLIFKLFGWLYFVSLYRLYFLEIK